MKIHINSKAVYFSEEAVQNPEELFHISESMERPCIFGSTSFFSGVDLDPIFIKIVLPIAPSISNENVDYFTQEIDLDLVNFLGKYGDRLTKFKFWYEFLSKYSVKNILMLGYRNWYNSIDVSLFKFFGLEISAVDIFEEDFKSKDVRYFYGNIFTSNSVIDKQREFDCIESYGFLGWIKGENESEISKEQLDIFFKRIKSLNPKHFIVAIPSYSITSEHFSLLQSAFICEKISEYTFLRSQERFNMEFMDCQISEGAQ